MPTGRRMHAQGALWNTAPGERDRALLSVCGSRWSKTRVEHVDPELRTIAECYRRGWFTTVVPGAGWQPCSPGTPGALPDLSRLAFFREHGYDRVGGGDR